MNVEPDTETKRATIEIGYCIQGGAGKYPQAYAVAVTLCDPLHAELLVQVNGRDYCLTLMSLDGKS